MHRRVYRNPPIQEAVCTFRFEPGSGHGSDLHDQFHRRIAHRFVHRVSEKQLEARVTVGAGGPTQEVQIVDATLFTDDERNLQVRVGPNVLAIHHRKPYRGWERFWPAIQLAYTAYCEVSKPKAINRISLRYVNMIKLPEPEPALDRYFSFYPHCGAVLPTFPGAFTVVAESALPGSSDVLRVHMGGMGHEDQRLRVILDLEIFLARQPSFPLTDAQNWLFDAHDRVGTAFEACIKNPLREKFGPREG
ncbi:MAG TPA: TIGR04255 family protein [Bacillota bacterium]